MSEYHKEELSAYMDGESGGKAEQVAEHLLKHEDMRQTWMRYHVIADAIRQTLPSHFDKRLATSVSDCLREEPTVLSPAPNRLQAYAKPVAGLAIAASVAFVAILGLQPQQQIPDPSMEQTDTALTAFRPNIPPFRQFNYPVRTASIDGIRAPAAVPVPTSSRQKLVNPRLNYYLVNHNEYHANAGMHGILPYVRMVANGNNE